MMPMAVAPVAYPPAEKSAGLVTLFTILWPGAGHLYLGMTKKGIPYVVANAIGVALGVLLLIFLPITFIIWLVTMLMLVGSISRDTEIANAAIRAGRPLG